MAQVLSLFPTPIYTLVVPEAQAMNEELRSLIERRRDAVPGVRRSNLGGWQSDADLMRWAGKPAVRLAAMVEDACTQWVGAANGAAATAWHAEMWANINRPGDANQSHWHPGSFLSFVYYVDDGYAGSTDRALGGELVFVDPRMPFLRMRTPHLRHRAVSGRSEEHETWVRPFSGLLIGFPSFLGHSVRSYGGNGTRLSIAINMLPREPHA